MDLLISIASLLILILGIAVAIIKIRKEFHEGSKLKTEKELLEQELTSKTIIKDSILTDNEIDKKFKNIFLYLVLYFILNFVYFIYQLIVLMVNPDAVFSNIKVSNLSLNIFSLLSTACFLIYLDLIKRYFKLYTKIQRVEYESSSNFKFIMGIIDKK